MEIKNLRAEFFSQQDIWKIKYKFPLKLGGKVENEKDKKIQGLTWEVHYSTNRSYRKRKLENREDAIIKN